MEREGYIYHEGEYYARVTHIIGAKDDFPKHDERAMANRNAKGIIGTEVHKLIEKDVEGLFVVPEGRADNYFNSYLLWSKAIEPTFHQSETRFFCKNLMITGCIDGLIISPKRIVPRIIDFKTCVSESKNWKLQAHFYHYLATVNAMKISDKVEFIMLKENKEPKVFEYVINQNVMNLCMQMVKEFHKSNL